QRLLRRRAGSYLRQLRGDPPRQGLMAEPLVDEPAVDVHAHLVPKGWPDLSAVCGGDGWPWLRIDSEKAAMLMVGEQEFRPVGPQAWDPATRLRDMRTDGVDLQVVSPTPVFFSYDRPARQAIKVARIFNDLTLEHTAAGAGRLLPFC